jgi:exodeoxyribonuclease VII large subunit
MPKATNEQKQEIIKLLREGHTSKEISEMIGITAPTVWAIKAHWTKGRYEHSPTQIEQTPKVETFVRPKENHEERQDKEGPAHAEDILVDHEDAKGSAISLASNKQPVKIYRLLDISTSVKDLLLDLSYQKFWIKAQLITNRGGLKNGHFYCELVDVDPRGNQVAKMRAMIWRPDYQKIKTKLQHLGVTEALKDNSEVCLLCSVRYHDVYGISLNIFDIDPSFGEAQIDRNRRMILEKLSAEGILKTNAQLNLRADALRIGLITSKDSAAYNDFIKTLVSSRYSFKIVLAHASMQGENTCTEVTTALKALIAANVDVVCIARGGGSQTDLAWFDNEDMARAIIHCPIPVWVGIGHEIDTVVPDYVAHASFKTPTAAAEALLERIQELDSRLDIAHDRIKNSIDRIVAKLEQDVRRLILLTMSNSKKYMDILLSKSETRIHRTESQFNSLFNEKENILRTNMHKIQGKSLAVIQVRNQTTAVKLKGLQSSCFNLQKSMEKGLNETSKVLNSSLQRYVDNKHATLLRNTVGAANGFRKHFSFVSSELMNRLLNVKAEFMQRFSAKEGDLFLFAGSIHDSCTVRIQDRLRKLETKHASLESMTKLLYSHSAASINTKIGKLSVATQVLERKNELISGKTDRLQLARFLNIISNCQKSLTEKERRLNVLTPENILRRGYSITRDELGGPIRSINQIDIGMAITTQYIDGIATSTITGKEENP